MKKDEKVYVVGHKNPDTDSICSAIAYADFKTKTTHGKRFIPKRAGQINKETEFVLKKFGMEIPDFILDVGVQVRDLEMHATPHVNSGMTILEMWKLMSEHNIATLPITDSEHRLEGIVSVTDVANFAMKSEQFPLAKAKTQYKSIAATLDGKVLVGNELGLFNEGRVVIATGTPETLQNLLGSDDLVITGEREEMQIAALEANASCIIVGMNSPVSEAVIELAKDNSSVVITTPYQIVVALQLLNSYYRYMPSALITRIAKAS